MVQAGRAESRREKQAAAVLTTDERQMPTPTESPPESGVTPLGWTVQAWVWPRGGRAAPSNYTGLRYFNAECSCLAM